MKKDYANAVKYHDKAIRTGTPFGYESGQFFYDVKQYDASTRYYTTFLKTLSWEHYVNVDQYRDEKGNLREAETNPLHYSLSSVTIN